MLVIQQQLFFVLRWPLGDFSGNVRRNERKKYSVLCTNLCRYRSRRCIRLGPRRQTNGRTEPSSYNYPNNRSERTHRALLPSIFQTYSTFLLCCLSCRCVPPSRKGIQPSGTFQSHAKIYIDRESYAYRDSFIFCNPSLYQRFSPHLSPLSPISQSSRFN